MTAHPEDHEIVFLTNTYDKLPVERDVVTELDLGCGTGSYTVELAKRFPERRVYAADVMVGRLRKLVRRRKQAKADNLTILRTEARYLIYLAVEDASFDRVHLLCPDPWPKGRHRGHRLLSSDFTAQLHRVLKKDGIFHFSSDDENYCRMVRDVLDRCGLFELTDPDPSLADIRSDFERRWNDMGKAVTHLYYRRLPLPPKTIGH